MTDKPTPARTRLTDTRLRAIKPTGQRFTLWDSAQPSLAARVNASGSITFYAVKRMPGQRQPTWAKLGTYPDTSLAKARAKAKDALAVLADGQNPKLIAAKKRAESCLIVIDEFLKRTMPRLRTGEMEWVLRKYLLGQRRVKGGWEIDPQGGGWAERPITSIERRDVVALIEGIIDDHGYRHQARKVLSYTSLLFDWCIARDCYGLTHSPTDRIKPRHLIGTLEARDRVLSDAELRLVWNAAERMQYPFGPAVQLLMLSGCRLREINEARWSEIESDVLTIDAKRIKTGEALVVPLVKTAAEIVAALPRFAGGDYLFSTTAGAKPVSGFSTAKERLGEIIAASNGGQPMADWRVHDLRRTVRTRLSALGVRDDVAEMVIGHKLKGVRGVYDRHRFDAEKRDALQRWEIALQAIVYGTVDNVVPLRPKTESAEASGDAVSPSVSPRKLPATASAAKSLKSHD